MNRWLSWVFVFGMGCSVESELGSNVRCADGGVACIASEPRVCVDVQSDPRHCGACANACSAGSGCVGGRCCGSPACGGRCLGTRWELREAVAGRETIEVFALDVDADGRTDLLTVDQLDSTMHVFWGKPGRVARVAVGVADGPDERPDRLGRPRRGRRPRPRGDGAVARPPYRRRDRDHASRARAGGARDAVDTRGGRPARDRAARRRPRRAPRRPGAALGGRVSTVAARGRPRGHRGEGALRDDAARLARFVDSADAGGGGGGATGPGRPVSERLRADALRGLAATCSTACRSCRACATRRT
jgi:hypothetical protein